MLDKRKISDRKQSVDRAHNNKKCKNIANLKSDLEYIAALILLLLV